ncbi:MAG TPA: hypothetical protein VFF64_00515 [Candidatus Eremiobacteraceae bacterium]|nr:hypothetical protein [Candidatus Eremiobacteraceae bacterium]
MKVPCKNIFDNNIVYAGKQNVWVNSFVKPTAAYPAPPAKLNWNLYYPAAGYVKGTSIVWGGVSSYKSYSAYQSTSGEDADSPNANPLFVDLGATPPNLDITASSPTVNAGSTSLPCSVGYCNGEFPIPSMEALTSLAILGRIVQPSTLAPTN